MFELQRSQVLGASVEDIWNFIRNPANLNRITPDDLDFKIITKIPDIMYDGLIIEYRVSVPLFGRKKWVTEIKHVRDRRSFVDEQRLGPYRFWYHCHEIMEDTSGTRIRDRVYYELPFGALGRVLHGLAVKKSLDRIFDHRRQKLTELFGSPAVLSQEERSPE